MTNELAPLDAEHAAFIEGRVSIIAASCGANNEPNLSRAVGCRVTPDRRTVTLFLFAAQSGALLADLRANGAIAVVFSEPSTHRTLQLKGNDANVAALDRNDAEILATYRQGFAAELAGMGYLEIFARTLLGCAAGDVVAVNFTVAEAFVQTPGPKAGTPLQPNQ